MIKKIICAFLLCFVTFLSHADTTKKYTVIKGQSEINLYADRTIAVLKSFFPEEELRESVITGILDSLKGETKGKKFGTLTLNQLEYICRVGGYDLSDDQDIDKCIKFVQAIASLSVDSYLEACGIDKDTPGAETHCINDVFYHYGDGGVNTQVTMLEAVNLSKEYLRMHPKEYSDDIIECSNEPRDGNYIQCRSMTGPTYYEFMFDDLTENKDKTADESLEEAICSLHDVEYSAAYHSPARYDDMGFKITDAVSAPSLCHTNDEKKCSDINETAQKFARKAIFRNNKCVLEYRDKLTLNNLRTKFGINNMQFSMGIQMMSSANMPDKLCEYIRNNADTTITDCYCDAAKQRVENDDVLTCFANGEPIDFLFDDLNEGNSTKQKAGLEGFNCELSGAQYQGKTCYVPDAKICEQIADMMAKDCPNCQRIRYNKDVNACVLPSSVELIEEHELKKVALIAGGAVLSGVIVVASGGTAGSVVYLVIETVGAGMEFGAQIHIDGVADEFFGQANHCNDATCAERILREFFAYLSRMTNDLHDTELLGIDRQMARLIDLLPNDSQFLIDTVAGCYENNGDDFDITKCDDGKWNNDQIIRAVGIGLQFTSVVASVGKWVLGTTKIANKIPNSIKALKNKISGVKSEIAKGGKVTRSDGKAIKALSKADTGYIGNLNGWKVSNIENVKVHDFYPRIYKFTEEGSGKVYYLKYTDELDEIKRTKRAYEILNGKSDIVHTVRVVEDDQNVLIDFTTKHNLPQSDKCYWFITEEMPGSKTFANLLYDGMSDLGGKPITLEEQEEILRSIKQLNDNGIKHGDLGSNMFLKREPNGKLRVDIIDYEPWSITSGDVNDVKFVQEMFQELAEKGGAEYKTSKGGKVTRTDGKANEAMRAMAKNSDGTVNALKQKQKLIDELDAGDKQWDVLMKHYGIKEIPNDPDELNKFLDEYPDFYDLVVKQNETVQELKTLKRNNPSLWEPGEDVADYYDVEALQQKLKAIADEDAEYIAELNNRIKELESQVGSDFSRRKARTDEVNNKINQLKKERDGLLKQYDDELKELRAQKTAVEERLRAQDPELDELYKKDKWHGYYDRIEEYPDAELQGYTKKINDVYTARRTAEKENTAILELDKQIEELSNTYKPEAVELINEQNYLKDLMWDAKKTIGDKQNRAWWDAIPTEIKEKYVQYKDDQIMKLIAEDDELSWYVNHFDEISNNTEEMNKFYKAFERKLNTVLPEKGQISVSTYYNPNTGTYASVNGAGDAKFNTAKIDNLEHMVGDMKHEVLSHRIDDVAPDYGLQGSTMQKSIPTFAVDKEKRIYSHGNIDPDITTARSPILGTEFSINDASDATQEALRNEGWKVYDVWDADTYSNYRAEVTERAAHSVTPTSDVKRKVNALRKDMGLSDMSSSSKP